MAVMNRMEQRARQVGRTRPSSKTFYPWFFQRVTGVFLVGLLAAHIIVNHFTNLGAAGVSTRETELITFENVAHRLAGGLLGFTWWTIDLMLLAFVLYHGLNGIRNIALDMGVKKQGDRLVTMTLTGIGVVAFGFGIAALLAFQRYH